jgi:serine/threonine-protein kinase
MRQEARASARVSHPGIVALHDMGDDPELGLYLVFEFVDGETLKERLLRGALAAGEAARLARRIGDALSTAHAAGVLHRDIKPENIILSASGGKIADFGIARVPDSTLTRDGGLLGTPAYGAPESLAKGQFSPASDQFSMAATLYEAVSGRRAFPGDDAVAVASRIATEIPPRFAFACGLDPRVDDVLSRGLAKDPHARFESAAAFGSALAEAIEGMPRGGLLTLPDRHHLDATELYAEAGASRTTRIAVGGAAVGALLAIAVFQLVAPLTAPPAAVPVAAHAAERPIGWLAERPRPQKAQRVASSVRAEAARRAVPVDGARGGDAGAKNVKSSPNDMRTDAGPSSSRIDEL